MNAKNYARLATAVHNLQAIINEGDATSDIWNAYMNAYASFSLASKRIGYHGTDMKIIKLSHDIEVGHAELKRQKF